MQIEELLLTKEEIPVTPEYHFFQIPVHPRLLAEDVRIDPLLAHKVFPKAVEEWHRELTDYTKKLEDPNMKKWVEKLYVKPGIKLKINYKGAPYEEYELQHWRDQRNVDIETGFAHVLRINGAGCCCLGVDGSLRTEHSWTCELSPSKIDQFRAPDGGLHLYKQHNVDTYPQALLMRNWGLLYLNETMKSVLKV